MSLLRITAHVAFVFALCIPHSSNSLLAKPGLCQWLHLSVSLRFKDTKVSSVQVCIQKDKSRDLQLLFPICTFVFTLSLCTNASQRHNIAALYNFSCCRLSDTEIISQDVSFLLQESSTIAVWNRLKQTGWRWIFTVQFWCFNIMPGSGSAPHVKHKKFTFTWFNSCVNMYTWN